LWTNEQITPEVRTTAQYVTDLRHRIEETCAIARRNLEKATSRHLRHFNKGAKARDITPGSKVLLLLPEKNNKLELTWKGPFVVTGRLNPFDYRIEVNGKTRTYHANMLKEYHERVPEVEASTVMHEEEIFIDEKDENLRSYVNSLPSFPLHPTEGVNDVQVNSELTTMQKKQVDELLKRHHSVLSDSPGMTKLESCTLHTQSDKPVHVKQYPIPYAARDTVQREIQEMLKLGVIEPSISAYSAPIVLVKKKDGSVRFCIDYRRLNNELQFDSEPMPDVDQLFAKLSNAKYFSKLDLSKGYWQIPVDEKDRHKTAFSTPYGQYQWTAMPFGLKTAGAIFTRMMRKLIQPMGRDDVDNFIDDVLIASDSWEQHLEALECVMTRLDQAGLTAKPSKCYVGFHELSYLGHQIGKGKIQPEDDKIAKLSKAERPTTKKEIRAFLGLAGYYRKFVPRFAEIANPLTDMTKAKQPDKVIWTKPASDAFETLKACLCKKPIMLLPDPSKDYTLRTDASDKAIGAMLLQDHGEGLQPVAYASKKLSAAELNYATIEKECLACIWAIKKFEPYLYGKQFSLETDHQPLKYLEKSKTENGRLMRWALTLQQYDYRVKVIKGKDNIGADFMSRTFADEAYQA
jgi:hypothetical protein